MFAQTCLAGAHSRASDWVDAGAGRKGSGGNKKKSRGGGFRPAVLQPAGPRPAGPRPAGPRPAGLRFSSLSTLSHY